MAGPWEKYAPVPGTLQSPSAGPWTRYGTPLEQADALPPTAPQQEAPGFWGTVGDMAQSAGTGLVRGAAELAMFPATAEQIGTNIVRFGLDSADRGVRAVFGMAPISDAEVARRHDDMPGVSGSLSRGIRAGQDAVRGAIDANLHQPTTTAGQFAQTAAEFVPAAAAMNPQAALSSAVRFGLIPGIASEGAGQLAEGTGWEGPARLAGGLLGGLAGGLVRSPASFAEAMTGRAAQGATQAQFRRAEQIIADARAQGVDLTAAEAVQAATGGATRLGDVQRLVESTAEGGSRTAPFFAGRPGQVQSAGQRVLGAIAPDTPTPSYQGQQLQEGAERVLAGLERQRTNATNPFYQRARTDVIPEPGMRSVLGEIDNAIAADNTGIIAGPLRDLRQRLIASPARAAVPAERVPVTGPNGQVVRYEMRPGSPAVPEQPSLDVENLDRVRKFFRDRLALPQFGQDAITKEQGAAITRILDQIDRMMLTNSADLAAGRATHQALSESLVNPAQAGPLGTIGRTADVSAQAGALMPRQPLAGSVAETQAAAGALAREAPDAARGVVRQGVEADFRQATSPTSQGRPDEFGGATFAQLVRQNGREPNVLAAIEATAGRDVRDQVERLTNSLAATGWRNRPGSLTAFNTEALADMKRGGVGALVRALVKPATAAKDAVERMRLGRQSGRLAELLLSGQPGVRRIAELAARAQDAPARDALIRALLTSPSTIGTPSR